MIPVVARTRIAAGIASGATLLGLTGAVLLASTYYGTIVSPPDDSITSVVAIDQPADESGYPEPPAPFTAAELETLTALDEFTDACMADAGFPEYEAIATWDPDHVVDAESWDADLSPARAAAASVAMWGSADMGADYRWQDAGCAGYGTHMIGADSAW
jgi:hypothetical protein